jgi:hypothetical protein
MEKKCIKCDVVKSASEFNKTKNNRDGLHSICGDCLKEKAKTFIEANKYYLKQLRQINRERLKQYYEAKKEIKREALIKREEEARKKREDINNPKNIQKKIEKKKEWGRNYREKNKEKIKETIRKWREKNKERIKEQVKQYQETNKEKILKYKKKYKEGNKEKTNKHVKSRRKIDSLYRLKLNTRKASKKYLIDGKSKRTREILGIEFKAFQNYLGKEYTEDMHLDHIIPLNWAINDDEVYTLNHYSNFQIISAEENLSKSDRYCKSENLKKVLDNHNELTKLNKIIERNSDKIK